MPRKKLCEHPTRHLNFFSPPKVQRRVPSRLNQFLRSRYELDDTSVSGLCAKCFALENAAMNENEIMDTEEQTNFNDDSSHDDDEENNANGTREEQNYIGDSSDEQSDDIDDEQSGDDSFYEITHQQQEAMATLSNIFKMLNVDPIHDRQVHVLILAFYKYPSFEGPT